MPVQNKPLFCDYDFAKFSKTKPIKRDLLIEIKSNIVLNITDKRN